VEEPKGRMALQLPTRDRIGLFCPSAFTTMNLVGEARGERIEEAHLSNHFCFSPRVVLESSSPGGSCLSLSIILPWVSIRLERKKAIPKGNGLE